MKAKSQTAKKQAPATANRLPDAPKRGQKHVRKKKHDRHGESIVQINLGHLVKKYASQGTVKACEYIATQLSRLAGMHNGDSWGWRYIASVWSGSLEPSRKFKRALDLAHQGMEPSWKQWHYFVSRHDVLSVYASTARAEIIRASLKPMGYRAVTYSHYMKIKHVVCKKCNGK